MLHLFHSRWLILRLHQQQHQHLLVRPHHQHHTQLPVLRIRLWNHHLLRPQRRPLSIEEHLPHFESGRIESHARSVDGIERSKGSRGGKWGRGRAAAGGQGCQFVEWETEEE